MIIMWLTISVEGEKCDENGLSQVLLAVISDLQNIALQDKNTIKARYGKEFESIAIIPSCVSDKVWQSLGWKERVLVRRKRREADIRLKMDYDQFCKADYKKKKALFVDVLIKSIRILQEESKADFYGEVLIQDIIHAVNAGASSN